MSQDFFKDQILEGLHNRAVCGKNEEDHDKHMINLMERATEAGMVFNSDKCSIKQKSISFFGNLYTDSGIKPDPAKIKDIQKIPTPQNKDELHRFLGMLTYLSAYIPKFAEKAHILRGLLKNEALWIWEADHQKCFEELKSAITEDACLKYYDASTPLTLRVDASQIGLGMALVQNIRPIAFGSNTPKDCQSR